MTKTDLPRVFKVPERKSSGTPDLRAKTTRLALTGVACSDWLDRIRLPRPRNDRSESSLTPLSPERVGQGSTNGVAKILRQP